MKITPNQFYKYYLLILILIDTDTDLMDLSKASDCILHGLLIAKLHAYGFNKKDLTFLYSYLKRRKASFKSFDMESFFQILLWGVPQGSIRK